MSPAKARAVLRLVALVLLPAALAGSALAQTAPGFGHVSSVRVDIGPLLAQGAGLQAEALRGDLTAALQKSLADRIGGTGPSLVVRISGLSMRPYAGSEGGRFYGGGTQNDYLEGEALLVGRKGEVLARHPQLSALPSSYGGAWYDPESERRRVGAIAEHYAEWLRRSLPAQ